MNDSKIFFALLALLTSGLAPLAQEPDVPEETAEEDTAPAAKEKEPAPSILTFADQTRISGFPLRVDGQKELLTLQSPSLAQTTPIKTSQLLELSLKGEPQPFESDHFAIATIEKHFRDSHLDTIRGRLVALNDESITLETWYAGELKLRRDMVRSLNIYDAAPVFYNGPNGPDGWVCSDGPVTKHWTFKNRSMTSKSKSSIAREIEIPEKAKITFTAQWKNSPYFRLLLFSDDPNATYPNEGYQVTFQRSYMSIYRNIPGERNNDIFNESLRNFIESETAEFTFYIDRTKEGLNALYIDGAKVGDWTDVDDTIFEGKWLHFIPQNASPMRFSKISVSQWDGILPKKAEKSDEETDEEDAQKGQRISLENGDVIWGTLSGIKDQIAVLETTFGKVGVPLRRMRNVGLSKDVDEVRMEQGDVRAWFHEGGYVTIKLLEMDDQKLRGYSQVWGEAEFDLKAFSRIEFNIWRQDLDLERGGDDSGW